MMVFLQFQGGVNMGASTPRCCTVLKPVLHAPMQQKNLMLAPAPALLIVIPRYYASWKVQGSAVVHAGAYL